MHCPDYFSLSPYPLKGIPWIFLSIYLQKMFTRVMQRVFLQDTFPAQLLVAAVAVGLQDVGVVAAPLVRPRGRLPGAGPWGGGSAGLAEDGRGGVPGRA